jgi:hypothetical protein
MNKNIDKLIDEMMSKEFEKIEQAMNEGRYGEFLPKITRLAENNLEAAQFFLAILYAISSGVEKNGVDRDDDKCVYWLRRASDNGNNKAKAWLGRIYINGVSVREDCSEGIKLLKEAADGNESSAAYSLTVIYTNGICVESDTDQARAWCERAIELGDRDAIELLPMIEEENPDISFRIH